jgi:hypothetical protein
MMLFTMIFSKPIPEDKNNLAEEINKTPDLENFLPRTDINVQKTVGRVIFDKVLGENGPTQMINPLFFKQNKEGFLAIASNMGLYIVKIKTQEVIKYDYDVKALAYGSGIGLVFSTNKGIFHIKNLGDKAKQLKETLYPNAFNLLVIKNTVFFLDSSGALWRITGDGEIKGIQFAFVPIFEAETVLFKANGNVLLVYGSLVVLFSRDLDILDTVELDGIPNKNILRGGSFFSFIPKYNQLTRIKIKNRRLGGVRKRNLNALLLLGFSKCGTMFSTRPEQNGTMTLQLTKNGKSRIAIQGVKSLGLSGDIIFFISRGSFFVIEVSDIINANAKDFLQALEVRKSSRLKRRFFSRKFAGKSYFLLQEGSRFTLCQLKSSK